jgi:hypothetical protein
MALARRKSEERRRKPPNVEFDPEPQDVMLSQEQVDVFVALMSKEIRGAGEREHEEGNDGQSV